MEKILSIILIAAITKTCAQELSEGNSACMVHDTCGTCVTNSEECHWCSDSKFDERYSRCNTIERLSSIGCPEQHINTVRDPYLNFNTNLQFIDIDMLSRLKSKSIQIRPQKVSMGLSPLKPQTLSFEYRPTKNFPLDLYYLMDLTWSMKDDKDTLLGLRNDLPPFLGNLTTNFRLAFGSFADKPLMPYISTTEERMGNPCSVESETCEATYAFRHRLSLTEKVDAFLDAVRNSSITANLDNAEGGLEALMQVMLCDDEVGWTDGSRKIVIFATDGILHYAGDGVLGGTVKPNDKICYLNNEGKYTAATHLDYPSLEQVFRVMLEKKVSVIFAVTEEVVPYYNSIKNIFPDYVFVGTLSHDSSNILNLVKQGYESLASIIKFEDDSDDDVDLIYSSNCGESNRRFVQTSKCEGVIMGKTYEFNVNVNLKDCPKNSSNYERSITISEVQLGQENILLDLKLLCDCNCENTVEKQCPKNSRFECGKCVCFDGWSGRNCDCNAAEYDALKITDECRKPGDGSLCSGAGDCFCGTCYCDGGLVGKYCECITCPVNETTNQPCSGRNQGICECDGTCTCRESWYGDACSCPGKVCQASWNDKQCSGYGTCTCGGCECWNINGEQYTGEFCETCANCENPACSVYEDCVKCVVLKNCTETSCKTMNSDIFYKMMKTPLETFHGTYCVIRLVNGNEDVEEYKYTYSQTDGKPFLNIHLQSSIVKASYNLFMLTVIVGPMIVLVGIIGISIYKYRLYMREKVDFQQYDASRKAAETGIVEENENPLYKSPISTFVVPEGYGKELKVD